MRADENSRHDEHVKMLEALGSNLKSEVARGLRLLDTCVTNIAQAKWILSNVDDCLTGFSKGCPVCGTPPEKEKPAVKPSTGKEGKLKPVSTDCSYVKQPIETDRVTITNKHLGPKPAAFQAVRKPSPSPPRSKPQTNSAPVHRVGPRSKTRPSEAAATSTSDSIVSNKPKIIDITFTAAAASRKLPTRLTLVVAQTAVQVELTDIKPYLRGRTTKVDLNNLNGFVSPTKEIPSDLKFKPDVVVVKPKTKKKSGPGPASKKFIESLKSDTSSTKKKTNVLHSSSSDEDKPVNVAPRPTPAAASKKNTSDSGSDYDYNFASSVPKKSNTSSIQNNKSKIGSQVTLNKRPRPQSTDSDEDYDYKNKKGSKASIFKKKVSEPSSSDSDSDSDAYDRKKKKKVKRKDSTDKEKDKSFSSKKEPSGSKASSVASSRVTITLNPSKQGSAKILNSLKSKGEPKIRRDSGSTTGSYAKSDTSTKGKQRDSSESREVSAKPKLPTSETAGKPIETTSAVPAPVKPAYRPGPASRKLKLAQQAVSASSGASAVKPIDSTTSSELEAQPKAARASDTMGSANKSEASTNGEKAKPTPTTKTDPFTLLKQQIKATQGNPNVPLKDKPVSAGTGSAGPGITNLMSALNTEAKAKLLAKLTLMTSQKKGPGPAKTSTEGLTPVQASLKALSALVKGPPKPNTAEKPPPSSSPASAPASDVDVEEDKEMELGDEVIGKCIGDIESSDAGGHVPGDHDEGSTEPIESEVPQISLTFEDCFSPTGAEQDAVDTSPEPEPDSPSATAIEKIQTLLLKFALEPLDDAALLHSQDKINELFAFGLHSNSAEQETLRGDLQEGVWYLVKGKFLGRAVCSDTVSVFEWTHTSEEDLSRILKELKEYTASCVS